ncbi:hypothetical protein ONE63_003574 [Megalurothrips usitatus]|uniref:Protein takeout-like n=1 Tax=Megalurothrips usitatus TaxID=439358 RepID=A0AAV7X6I3_9NEOP|nr:hypothetical protein ONE63_003574 [Megalurothrips usitatus]
MRVLVMLCLAAASNAATTKTLPYTWKKCAKTDPAFRECFREAIEVAVRELSRKGAKGFGVFPIDPLFLSRVDLERGRDDSAVAIDLHFRDVNFHGLKNTKVLDVVKADISNYHFKMFVQVAKGVTLKGQYKMDGKVLVLPITGEGKCEISLENITAHIELRGNEVIKDGQKYGYMADWKFLLDTTRLRMSFDNRLNSNKQLGKQMDSFLNDNWNEIWQELRDDIQEAFSSAFREIFNRIFTKIPYDNLFPHHL